MTTAKARDEGRKLYLAAWRAANRDKVAAIGKRYREKNKERLKEVTRAQNAKRAEYRKEWYQANREHAIAYARVHHIEVKYGLSVSAWNALFAAQHGKCAICRTETPGGNGWATDHSHDSGQTRGILCQTCNLGIGLMGDDVGRLRAAIAYLERVSDDTGVGVVIEDGQVAS